MRPLDYAGVVVPVWYNRENYLFILSLNSSEPYVEHSKIRHHWRICQATVIMETKSFTGKELATQEKSVLLFITMGLKQSLNLRRNLRLRK